MDFVYDGVYTLGLPPFRLRFPTKNADRQFPDQFPDSGRSFHPMRIHGPIENTHAACVAETATYQSQGKHE